MADYVKKLNIRSAGWNYGGANWKLSRSKIELFLNCPLCFYVDNKLGVARPKPFPMNLNIAVDTLLKKEFDIHRKAGSAHPLMDAYGLKDVVPFKHEELDVWRENFQGMQYMHEASGLRISGAVDDLWVNKAGELIIVDYKATSKEEKVSLDADWQIGYKRQMEIYQWLFRKCGYKVSSTGYFVYCNGKTDKKAFDSKLEFEVELIPYTGDDSWVERTIFDVKKCLESPVPPKPAVGCEYCFYRKAARDVQQEIAATKKAAAKK
ncbi:MAG TPA: PD-(D/E)XK nuclease family protein [Candidatus Paceibacterota bacterium]